MAQACYALTAELLARDPYALEAMPVHLAAALDLGKKNELFLHSHRYANTPSSKLCLAMQCKMAKLCEMVLLHVSGKRHAKAPFVKGSLAEPCVDLM